MNQGKEKGRHFGFEYDDWKARDRYPYPDRVEDRFRDRSGREHYDNGRFAPRSEMDGPYGREYRQYDMPRYMPEVEGRYPGSRPMRYREDYDRPIGFNRDWGAMGGADATIPQYREMDRMPGNRAVKGFSSSDYVPQFDKRMAEEWTSRMQNEDGTTGPHWSLEQTKQVMTQRSINCDPYEFWAALNMIYSDYSKVAKKHNVGGNLDFYVDMAKAFLEDKDAAPDKLAKYYEYVVK